jgi:fructose-bisphosphate aldolase class II
MWDGSAVPLDENLQIAEELLAKCAAATSSSRSRSAWSAARRTASQGAIDEKLYTTPQDALATVEALGLGREGPLPDRADLRQRARRLQARQRQAPPGDPQDGAGARSSRSSASTGRRRPLRPGLPRRLRLDGEEIARAVDYGVVKMNVDTDTHSPTPARSPTTCSTNTAAC